MFLLHGWQDTGDTFQFMIDRFEHDWPLVALDWRGFGRSEWPREGYWFPDYLADLDASLERLCPDAPARIVGHSMGGNVASMYAGLRPQRVRCLANLEGLGLPPTSADQAPGRLVQWLDQTRSTPVSKDYESLEQLTSIVQFRYPRFSAAQANFVAASWSERQGNRVRLLGDPRHRWVNPVRYLREEAQACWRLVEAPVLLLVGEESEFLKNLGEHGGDAGFRSMIPHMEIAHVEGAGHMLHIEKAEVVASLVERFLSAH